MQQNPSKSYSAASCFWNPSLIQVFSFAAAQAAYRCFICVPASAPGRRWTVWTSGWRSGRRFEESESGCCSRRLRGAAGDAGSPERQTFPRRSNRQQGMEMCLQQEPRSRDLLVLQHLLPTVSVGFESRSSLVDFTSANRKPPSLNQDAVCWFQLII